MAQRVQGTVITLRQFMADAAHELHTPLTALHTNLELLGQTTDQNRVGPTDEIRLERAKSQLLRLQDLTDSLLELSRIEANQVDQERQAVNLNELVQTSSELYASRAEQAGLAFEMTLPSKIITVAGDVPQLQQALNNLLDNSTKFTPQPGQVGISLYQEDSWGVIAVTDTGIGVPEADLPQLFSRFHRGRNTTDYPGSGLGLAIVKAIIEAHDGRVQVANSGPGQGCTFTLHLPLSPGALAE
jgi:signal transduction histidine kinase